MGKRKEELSLQNIICALAVIFIHVSSEAVVGLRKESVSYGVIYSLWQAASFVVFGFVFLSGIKQFMGQTEKFDMISFYKKRLLKIVVPYILWVGIYFVYDLIMGVSPLEIKNFVYFVISGDYIGHFYFVVLIVQFYLLMPIWFKLFKSVSPAIMIPSAFGISVIFGRALPDLLRIVTNGGFDFRFADRIFTTYFLFWTMGAYIGLNYQKCVRKIKENRGILYLLFGIATVLTLAVGLYQNRNAAYYAWFEDLLLIYRVAAVFFVFAFSLGKVNRVMDSGFMRTLDASSYNIYLSHLFVLRIVDRLLNEYEIFGLKERYIIRFAAVYTISLGMCMLYTMCRRILKEKIRKGDK